METHLYVLCYETTCCATHVLAEGGRPLEPLHGHDWRVEVVAAGERLDGIGVVVDFEHLKRAVGEVTARFHYKDINAHPAFTGQSPSAEAVARYFFQEVRKGMGAEGEHLRRRAGLEAPRCRAPSYQRAGACPPPGILFLPTRREPPPHNPPPFSAPPPPPP